jgi:hypothetical protein
MSGPRLPVAFLTGLAGARAGSAQARLALAEAQRLAPGPERDRLLAALLAGACRTAAPGWLLTAAAGGGPEPAAAALTHPDCPAGLRARTLRDAPDERLPGFAGPLAAEVAAELIRRTPHRPAMTAAMRERPTPAQTVLRATGLPDAVFDAAVPLLPGPPEEIRAGEDMRRWMPAHRVALHAWKSMWLRVLVDHQDRHTRLLALLAGTPAAQVVRDHLLGTLPWAVEPTLLGEVAAADLDRFAGAMLAARVCRAVTGGLPAQEARERFAGELRALPPAARPLPEAYLGGLALDTERGRGAAADWVARAAEERWRHLLHPPRDRPWRTPPEDLAALGRRFGETARAALALWEPVPHRPVRRPRQVRWVRDMLAHLPAVPPEVRAGARLVLADAALGRGRRDPEFDALLTEIERRSAAALGDPAETTVPALADLPPETLHAYLDSHPDDDALVEKALLAHALRQEDAPAPGFGALLDRHGAPADALHRLTHDLRALLGGGPHTRARWTHAVLSLPDCPPATVRALPGWAALAHGGPAVTAAVRAALAGTPAAWPRLAAGPAAGTGPHAWLRLGDLLDAARDATGWPRPPEAAQPTEPPG